MVQPMRCNRCNATYAVRYMWCDVCDATYVMQCMRCNRCGAMYAMQAGRGADGDGRHGRDRGGKISGVLHGRSRCCTAAGAARARARAAAAASLKRRRTSSARRQRCSVRAAAWRARRSPELRFERFCTAAPAPPRPASLLLPLVLQVSLRGTDTRPSRTASASSFLSAASSRSSSYTPSARWKV